MCTAMPKRYALLVGIDLYLNDGSRNSSTHRKLSLHNLRGCTNDVEAIGSFLRDEYEFENISILTSSFPVTNNEEAIYESPTEPPNRLPTFANIEAEFDAVYKDAVAGDFFFFHYSGHGARLQRQRDSPKSNRIDEPSLITVDFCCGQPAVRGWKLNQWLKRLNEKGIYVVATLDSCYSGGSWRSTGDYQSFRTPRGWDSVPSMPADDQAAANSVGITERARRDAELETSWSINPESFTLMAACGSQEYAAEKVVNGKKYGAFTWELLEYLRHSRKRSGRGLNVTYRMISDQLRACLEGQTPEVYGRDRLLFFGSHEPFFATPIVVQAEGNKITIPVGRAHGVNIGSEFMISSDLHGAAFTVDNLEELQCNAVINDKLLLLLKHFRHTVTLCRWSLGEEKTLRVYVDLAYGSDFRNRLQHRLTERITSPIELLESAESPMDGLQLNKLDEDDATIRGPAWLTGSDGPVRPLNLKKGSTNELAASAAFALAHLARFRQILLLRPQSSSEQPFNVTIKPVNGNVAALYPLNQKFRFTFANNSDYDLHITVMVFSPEFSIEQLYPSRDYPQTISGRQKKSFNFSMRLPDGPKWVTESCCRTFRLDIIRTLVTTGRRVSWKCLELPNIWDCGRADLCQPQSSMRNSSTLPEPNVDWYLHDEKIVTGSARSVQLVAANCEAES